MRAPSLRDLRREFRHVTVTRDDAAMCYRAEAAHGFRFLGGPHELVVAWEVGEHPGEARAFMRERLRNEGEVEPCNEPDCDWCRDTLGEVNP